MTCRAEGMCGAAEQLLAQLRGVPAAQLPKVVNANKLPVGAWLLAGEDDESLVAHRERHDLEKSAYQEILDGLRGAGVDPVFLKTPDYFPYTTDNLDLLVLEGQLEVARRCLSSHGWFEVPMVREPEKWLYRKFTPAGGSLALHLHTEVAWISRFIDGSAIVARSRNTGERRCPSPTDVCLITVAHALYEDKCVRLRDLYNMRVAVLRSVNWELAEVEAYAKGWATGWRLGVCLFARLERQLFGNSLIPEAVLDAYWAKLPWWAKRHVQRLTARGHAVTDYPVQASRMFWKCMHVYKTLTTPGLQLSGRLKEIYLLAYFALKVKGFLPYRPVVVSISGPDGAGKTSLGTRAVELLTRIGIRSVLRWSRLASSPQLVRLQRAVRGGRRSFRRGKAGGSKFGSWVAATFFVLELGIQVTSAYLLAWARQRRVIVYDRYHLDALVDLQLKYGRTKFVRGLARALASLTPRPDFEFLVLGPPSVLGARTGDYELAELQCRLYGGLRGGAARRELSALIQPEEASSIVVREILEGRGAL